MSSYVLIGSSQLCDPNGFLSVYEPSGQSKRLFPKKSVELNELCRQSAPDAVGAETKPVMATMAIVLEIARTERIFMFPPIICGLFPLFESVLHWT